MGSPKVILYQPFSHFLVKENRVFGHIPKLDKLLLNRAIETFVNSIVFWCSDTTPPVWDVEFFAGVFKVFVKFTPVVGLDVLNFSIQKIVESSKKV